MGDFAFQGSGFKSYRTRQHGRIIDQMPLLLADGRLPMTPRELLVERVHGVSEHDRNLLRNNYVDTACAVITDSTGEVLIGLYSDPFVEELIHSLNPQSGLRKGSLPVGADAYHEIKRDGALVIPAGIASDLRDGPYSHQKTREEFWEYVTEGDRELVDDHLRLVQERNGGNMSNRMGLWLSNAPGLRLVCAGSVGGYYGDGYAIGYGRLDDYGVGRLVGVASAGGAAGMKGARERAAQNSGPYREPSYPARPSLEEVLEVVLPTAQRYAPAINHEGMKKDIMARLSQLYEK